MRITPNRASDPCFPLSLPAGSGTGMGSARCFVVTDGDPDAKGVLVRLARGARLPATPT